MRSLAALIVGLGAGTGVTSARHRPDEPRVIFNRQTRQIADPTTVVVPRADLPDGGWVVVHGGDHSGHSGDNGHSTGHHHRILGVTDLLPPGHYGGLKVELSTVPAPGTEMLTAMLHRNTGDDEEFTHDETHEADPHYGPPTDRAVAEVTFRETS
jgi:hypothetical protein